MTTRFFFDNLWRWKCGIPEIKLNGFKNDCIIAVFKCNWSPAFERFMRNRLAMGYYRYGPLNTQEKGEYKNIKSIRDRLRLYERTGNDEVLVDIANLCMVEFVNGAHPKKHFKACDDGVHTERS